MSILNKIREKEDRKIAVILDGLKINKSAKRKIAFTMRNSICGGFV